MAAITLDDKCLTSSISHRFHMIIYDSIFNLHLLYIVLRLCNVVVIIVILVALVLFPFDTAILPWF